MLNDKDMDVLIGRFTKGAAPGTPVEHPDADELNAFAEGALPAAARQNYIAHFAECDDCRKLVSQLAVTANAGAEARVPAMQPVSEPWWKKFSAVFALPALRYAAFALVLVAVVGIAFLVWRRPEQRNADLIAQNQPASSPAEVLKSQPNQAPAAASEGTTKSLTATTPNPQPTVIAGADRGQAGLIDATDSAPPPPPPKPADLLAAKQPAAPVTGTTTTRADDQPRAESSPSYAPAPQTEYRVENRGRENQNLGNVHGGPRRNETYDKSKAVDRMRSGDLAKERDEDRPVAAKRAATVENKQDAAANTSQTKSEVANNRAGNRNVPAARKAEAPREVSEEAPETRSAGGRKFMRRGNAWVDTKFKSSMSVRSVARGSEDFDKLDSGLRAIAGQLGGEVIVVWKGKAYRIR